MKEIAGKIIELRRYFHKYPELANREKNTAGKIAAVLRKLGLKVEENIGRYGVVGLLEGEGGGDKTIALRADMDGLPVAEENEVEYRSRNEGVMHACGHDAHMAIVLGAAHILAHRKKELAGNVKFIFTPAEEKPPGGVKFMIEDGVLKNPSVDAIIGIHNTPNFAAGTIIVPEGPVMAGSDSFALTVKGAGGHGADPAGTQDTILLASNFVVGLENILSRKFSIDKRPIISFGKIRGGRSHNIIPKEVKLSGTIRYFTREHQEEFSQLIDDSMDSLTDIFGGDYTLEYNHGYPVTENDASLCQLVRCKAAEIGGIERVTGQLDPAFVSEDYGYFSQLVTSCYFFFGVRNEDRGYIHPLHTERFNLDEGVLPRIAEILSHVVEDYLDKEK